MNKHVDREYEAQLAELSVRLSGMMRGACAMATSAFLAWLHGDEQVLSRIGAVEPAIDRLENEIDEQALSLLALRQPMASDLRAIVAALKQGPHLERIADAAYKVAKGYLQYRELGVAGIDAPAILRPVQERLNAMCDVVEHFCALPRDREIDALRALDKQLDAACTEQTQALTEHAAGDPGRTHAALLLHRTIRYAERIGDHCVDIAEYREWAFSGAQTRHCGSAAVNRGPVRGILFLCVHNSARSQMAQGLARAVLPASVRVFSAGSNPAQNVNPLAIESLARIGIDISSAVPRRISDIPLEEVDTIITLCAEEVCLDIAGAENRASWLFDDPGAVQGSAQETARVFDRVRDELHRRVCALRDELQEPGEGQEQNVADAW